MKTILRAYKYRLLPNKNQRILLAKHFGCTRWIFNHFLGQRKEQYESTKKSDNYNTQSAKLTQLKKQAETSWLKEVNSQPLQQALKHLDRAYNRFFKGLGKYPRFKSKKQRNSFTVPQNVFLVEGKLSIGKFREGIPLNLHRPIGGKIKQCTVSITPTGKYFVSILCEEAYQPLPKTKKATGIDVGLKDYATLANGAKSKNHKYLKRYSKKLSTVQKHLSRKQKGSCSFEKQRRKVARLHEKIANCRRDILIDGLKILSAGMVDHTGGGGDMSSVKPEAHRSLAYG